MTFTQVLNVTYFSVAIENIFCKKNCHVLNNGFKMEMLRHLNSRSLYASQNGNWGYSMNNDFFSNKSIYIEYTFLIRIHMSQ